jgi:hypothetical protein
VLHDQGGLVAGVCAHGVRVTELEVAEHARGEVEPMPKI